jgi:hypothetical protein
MPAKADGVLATAVDALGDVLGTMFFSDVAPVECRHSLSGEWTAARVRFSGTPSGEMLLMLSPGVAVIFAASFLGIEEAEVTAEEAGQVCCELSNMICGAILSRVHPDSLVALDVPELLPADFENHGGFHQCFAIPEGTLAINLSSDAW